MAVKSNLGSCSTANRQCINLIVSKYLVADFLFISSCVLAETSDELYATIKSDSGVGISDLGVECLFSKLIGKSGIS